jgi:hypothetical protein
MATSAAGLANKFYATASGLRQMNASAVGAVALRSKNLLLNELTKAIGSDHRMSRVGRKGARLGVRYDVKGTDNATALVRATGPWQLIEGPTKPHEITSKAGRRGRGRRKPISTPYGPRMSAQHPGTRGKHPWQKGKAKAEKEAVDIYAKAQRKAVARAFR